MSIGNNLRRARTHSGMTQAQAAEYLHLTRQALSSYENDRTKPDIEMLQRLAEIYGCELDELIRSSEPHRTSRDLGRRFSVILGAVLAALSITAPLLAFLCHRFFGLSSTTAAHNSTVRIHFLLLSLWSAASGLLNLLALLGFTALLVMQAVERLHFAARERLIWGASLSAALILPPLLFSLFDQTFKGVDYCLVPLHALAYLLLALGLSFLIDRIKRRHTKKL